MSRRRTGALVGVAAALALAAGCGGDDEGSAEELCEAVRSNRAVDSVFAGFDPTDTERALEQLRTARVTLGELLDAAPGEVRDALTVEIEYVQALVDGLEAVDGGDAAQAVAVVSEVTAAHPDVEAAARTLADFSAEHCGR